MDYDKDSVKICLKISKDESHIERRAKELNLQKDLRDKLEHYFSGMQTLQLEDSFEIEINQRHIKQNEGEVIDLWGEEQNEKICKAVCDKIDLWGETVDENNVQGLISNDKIVHSQQILGTKDQIEDEEDNQLVIQKSQNVVLNLELGYQSVPTPENRQGNLTIENTKVIQFQIPEIPDQIVSQTMVLAVLNNSQFTSVKSKNFFGNFFQKQKAEEVENFYIKPFLEISYTSGEYKNKKSLARVMKSIQKLQVQNNEDYRKIDVILGENKQAAINVGQKQKQFEAMEEEISKKLVPIGKDITWEKRINEVIFLAIIGVWFACVTFFNPKLVA